MWVKIPYKQSILNTDNVSHFYRQGREILAGRAVGDYSMCIAAYIDEDTAQKAFQCMMDRNFEYVKGDTYKLIDSTPKVVTLKVKPKECRIKRREIMRRMER